MPADTPMPPADPQFRRRNFLGLIGAGAGVSLGSLIVANPASGLDSSADGPRAQVVGVVVPKSRLVPELGANFSAGFAIAAERIQHERGVRLSAVTEELDVGGAGLDQAVTKLLGVHRVRVIAGVLDARLASAAATLCGDSALFMDCGMGGTVPLKDSAPGFITCGFGHWQSAYGAGRWSGGPGKRAVILSTLFEAGYDSLYAFRLGFEDAGGTIDATVVVDVPGKDVSLNAIVDQLKQSAPDVIYAALHDYRGAIILNAIAGSSVAQDTVIIGTPFLANVAGSGPVPMREFHVCTSYDPALDLPANATFSRAYSSAHGRLPDAFAVLGHDCAQVASAALGKGDWLTPTPQLLAQRILAATIDSPRGRLTFDAHSGCAAMPHYLTQVSRHPHGIERRVIAAVPTITMADPRIAALRTSERSGWTNPYLSV